MVSAKTEKIGYSFYQREACAYYRQLRRLHSRIYTSEARKAAEKSEERYTQANAPGIINLYSLIGILVRSLPDRQPVRGMDYGCGSHYFVDDMVRQYGWDVTGCDPDRHAIREARRKYKANARRYVICNPLLSGLPRADNTQDFVFCNAVIQHFSDAEVKHMLSETGRVLKPGGRLLLIFKRKPADWREFSGQTGFRVNILDAEAGAVEVEDTAMKKALEQTGNKTGCLKNKKWRDGMRLFRFFSVDEILRAAAAEGLAVCQDLPAGGRITYCSGKGIPTAALYLTREAKVL